MTWIKVRVKVRVEVRVRFRIRARPEVCAGILAPRWGLTNRYNGGVEPVSVIKKRQGIQFTSQTQPVSVIKTRQGIQFTSQIQSKS